MDKKMETVKVCVRCRPLSQTEMKNVNMNTKSGEASLCNPNNQKETKTFYFDSVYDYRGNQEEVFNNTARPILESVMKGYNGTIFAYGQTGTGKTHTMEGQNNPKDKGVVPRTIDWIFDNIKSASSQQNQQFLVRVSMVEIYNEEVRDLFSTNTKHKLNIREKEGAFYVEDCKIKKVESAQQMMGLFYAGRDNRATRGTDMNLHSSRSHLIFTIIVENSTEDQGGETHYRMGKLNLVDLAGSERQSKTNATGEGQKEAIKINLSLTVLGNVISSLTGTSKHIPYRESKLTMLLCDSLGGNTKTVMIANIGPADYNYDESLNTLWYADRAKRIKNKPVINEDPKDAQLRQYQEEIEVIRSQLNKIGKGDFSGVAEREEKIVYVEDESKIKEAEDKLEKQREEFKKNQEGEIKRIQQQKNIAEEEKVKLIEKVQQKIQDQKKVKDEAKGLLHKYKDMKKKILKGTDTEQKVKRQEEEIQKAKEELDREYREEKKLQNVLDEKEKRTFKLQQKYESNQAQADDLTEKIQLLRNKIEEVKRENKENQEHLSLQLTSIMEEIKIMEVENQKKEFIMSSFIPPEESQKIHQCLEYNEKDNNFFINKIEAIKNNYKNNREALRKMKKNKIDAFSNMSSIFKYETNPQDEQIIHLRLDAPEKIVMNFTGEPNELLLKEMDHILKDDDSDLLYFDKELNIFDNNLNETAVRLNKNMNSTTTSSNSTSTTSTSTTGFQKPVIGGNKEQSSKPKRIPSAKAKRKEG